MSSDGAEVGSIRRPSGVTDEAAAIEPPLATHARIELVVHSAAIEGTEDEDHPSSWDLVNGEHDAPDNQGHEAT